MNIRIRPGFIFFLVLLLSSSAFAAENFKTLPAPDKSGGKPLMSALAARHAARSFAAKALPDQLVSDMLWAAFGINRPDGRRTAPTGKNVQDIDIYVLLPDGVWLYEPQGHALKLVSGGDARRMAIFAPAVLLYAADRSKSYNETASAMHVGSIYQNVGLFCASAGLNNVVAQRFNASALNKVLNLPNTHTIMISQSVGYPPDN